MCNDNLKHFGRKKKFGLIPIRAQWEELKRRAIGATNYDAQQCFVKRRHFQCTN